MRRWVLIGFALVMNANDANAQVIARRQYQKEPTSYATLGVAYAQFGSVYDGSTNTQWNFGDAMQYRVSFEKGFTGGGSFGVAATTAQVPMTFYGTGVTCLNGCDAHARISQLFGLLHLGGNRVGPHQVLEANAGVTLYSEFHATDNTPLPDISDPDFAFALGYGFGYALSAQTQVEIVEDWGLSIHQRVNVSGQSSTSAQYHATRLTVRLGLGI